MKKLNLLIILIIFLAFQRVYPQEAISIKIDPVFKTNYLSKFGATAGLTERKVILTDCKILKTDFITSANPLIKESNLPEDLTELKPYRFGLYVNPLGFVEFGPIVGAEFTLFSHLIIDAHVRFASLGLLMPVISKNDDGVSPYQLDGMGVGGGLKFLFASDHGGLYLGIIAESAWQTQYFEEGEPWESKGEIEYLAAVSNIGYKFAFESGFYINLGAYLGAAVTTKNEWQYTNNYNGDNSIHTSDPATRPFVMIEACFGFDFIKF